MPVFPFGPRPPEPESSPAPEGDFLLDETQRVQAHRFLNLLGLKTNEGETAFTPDDALHLLTNPRLDWHEADRLLKKGCPPEMVIRILE